MCRVEGCNGWTNGMSDLCFYCRMWGDVNEQTVFQMSDVCGLYEPDF